MPINASPEFFKAQGEYRLAKTKEEKIRALENLIMLAPKHKGSENLLANLKSKLAKLRKEVEKERARKKAGHEALVKKTADVLVVLIGITNAGRSSLLAALTNAMPKISPWPFTTLEPEQGVFDYTGCKIQVVELPALKNIREADAENLSIARVSDLIVIVATSNEEINSVLEELKNEKIKNEILIVHNKKDIIPKVPIKAEISVSALSKENIQELKDKIFSKLKIIRVYTKEPGKKQSNLPVVLKQGSSIRDLAEKIRRDFAERFSHAIVWGKSVKFQGQRCGLDHKLEDLDVVEIYLRK